MKDLSLLDNLIVGRVEPHIYAFTTNTVPNYLKVGDTYRPVSVRLKEWQTYYPELEKQFEHTAKVAENAYFRDHSVHQYLESDLHKERLKPENLDGKIYYSNEFFKNTDASEVADAIADIAHDYESKGNKYKFYNPLTSMPTTVRYASTGYWEPRPNQKATINAFKKAVESGRTNLLMYAVMRFGKSFTSMCCAKEMNDGLGARLVVVVSAKADVKEEWRKTIECAENFRNDYEFLSSVDLERNHSIVTDILSKDEGINNVVLFLTLQDLQGDVIKEKHQQIFGRKVDLLIIDETHFGARAEKYGQVLKDAQFKGEKAHKKDDDDYVEITDAEEQIKVFDAKIKLHLSGTPYRILMGGEFQQEDIIAFYQFSDIVREQEAWDKENLLRDDVKEWDNPYYGFPQMIRFAFNPNESSIRRLEELRMSGVTYALSALFKPKSIKKSDDDSHKKFIYENEVLDLLEIIDGTKDDENLLSFLDYEKIKSGMMCRHIVCVLPYCASCDALESLIKNNAGKFKNLNQYEIINISGVENTNSYKTPKAIKDAIKKCESKGKKTITLTVNRMLTGSTVEEWDTMIYLKDTSSPQEYDQAIFRLQNQYVKTYIDVNGEVIKYNMKPQTLLVDFDPNRMFQMQEQKSQIYNVNVDVAGNSKLSERISEELRISPIIVMNKGKIEQITATDILKAVSEYSRNRGVAEETNDIPVDLSLMGISDIWDVIGQENELGSKAGFETKAAEGEGNDINVLDPDDISDANDRDRDVASDDDMENATLDDNDTPKKDPAKQFRMYYARILYFAFLTKDTVISLDNIIDSLNSAENVRIFRNLGLDRNVVIALKNCMDKFMLRILDYKVQNLNQLSHDESVPALERATIANQKFGKLGESQVVTPASIANDMVALLPEDFLRQCVEKKKPILDLASKEGEFAVALCKRFEALNIKRDAIKDIIYSITTSPITYEFTRKIYEVLDLNIDNIATKFNTYDMLKVINAETGKIDYAKVNCILLQNKPFSMITMDDENFDEEADKKVKFSAIVGNPPYQLKGGSGGSNDAPIYQHFVEIAHNMEPEYISLIIPAKWFTTGREHLIGEFRKNMLDNQGIKEMVSYSDSHDVFPDVSIKGGICYYLYDSNYSGDCTYTLVQNNIKSVAQRKLNEFDILIQDPKLAGIIRKVSASIKCIDESVASIISGDTPFGIPTNPSSNSRTSIQLYNTNEHPHDTMLFYLNKSVRTVSYIDGSRITKNAQDIHKHKVFMPKAYGAGDGFPHQIIGQPEYGPPNSVCSQTYLYAAFNSKNEAINFINYAKTKMFRALVLASKISQDLPSKAYRFVPILDFKHKWTDTELYSKYGLTDDEIALIESIIKPME